MVFRVGASLTTCSFIYKKKSIMWIGSWQNLQCLDSLDIYLDNEIIQQVETQKLLGLIIDRFLHWNEQINAACLNITRRITVLKQLCKYVDKDSLKLYYNSYIFDYGCILWSRTSALNTTRLLKLQKRVERIILGYIRVL